MTTTVVVQTMAMMMLLRMSGRGAMPMMCRVMMLWMTDGWTRMYDDVDEPPFSVDT